MQLPERLIRLFDYPVGDILAAMPDVSDPLWEANPHRQTKHAVHRETRSIIFDWIDDRWQPGQPAQVQRLDCGIPALTGAVDACAAVLNTRYRGRIIRLLLAELAPHGKIAPHRDGGAGTVLVHRLHVPVLTDPEVKFYIDEIPHMLEAGVAYEFDNTRRHAVENESDRPRIHLMCDILPASLVV
ncbi:MAG: aspartyl/asparaginyl beta-hydroxylase domain-containing protein [Rhizomicrobium sp.]